MNDDPDQKAHSERALHLLAQSSQALDEALFAFDLMARGIREGEQLAPLDLAKVMTAIGTTRTKLISEVKEHDHRVLLSEGRIGDAPLDLDAIRSEIGRRLDRIHAALDEDGVS